MSSRHRRGDSRCSLLLPLLLWSTTDAADAVLPWGSNNILNASCPIRYPFFNETTYFRDPRSMGAWRHLRVSVRSPWHSHHTLELADINGAAAPPTAHPMDRRRAPPRGARAGRTCQRAVPSI